MQTVASLLPLEQDPGLARETRIDETVLARFDAAIVPFQPAAELISLNGQQGLSTAMSAFVKALSVLNVDRISREFSWYERFTGLDIQARIEFDLAARELGPQMVSLGVAAGRARQTLGLLQSELLRLGDIRVRHEALIADATKLLAGKDMTDYHVGRFQRRLANLEALAASDRMAEAQMSLAIESLTTTLDRHSEIEKLLFPVWQQHALAIAQAPGDVEDDYELLRAFRTAHQRLADRFVR